MGWYEHLIRAKMRELRRAAPDRFAENQ